MAIQQEVDTAPSAARVTSKIGGIAGLVFGVLLLTAVASLATSSFQPALMKEWLSPIENNWLVSLFKLHFGLDGVQSTVLHQLRALDMVLLVLYCLLFIGLYFSLRRTSRAWSIVAAVQPILGIVIFLVTKTAGRSAVMGALLVISVVMLWSKAFGRATAVVGILASVLLLLGDISEGMIHSVLIGVLMGVGYLLFLAWIGVVTKKLLQRQ
jgi:hypothetical protein